MRSFDTVETREGLRQKLTGLPAASAVRDRIEEWIAEEDEYGGGVHAMLIGLRRFDAINLAYGSATGDGALEEVVSRISHFAGGELDSPWLIARAGGGTFLLVASEAGTRERWQLLADQLVDAISRPIAAPMGILRLSPRIALLSAGIGEAVDSIFDRLAQTLARAHDMQGVRSIWAEGEATPPGRSAAQLEADLLGAIDRDEIEILFQPQFGVADDVLSGGEALARWNHPKLGRIGAGAMFTIAERADHVAPISQHIAAKALKIAGAWPEHLRLSLNITPADLAFGRYTHYLFDLLDGYGFAPERLTLEVTEQALISDIALAAQSMAEFRSKGIRIALDDFGAGFCNFRYLKVLPLNYLKLDRSMIEGITRDDRDVAVLRAIVAMARALDLEVIAEGIETPEQHCVIADEGCTYYQGFLRAQPMSGAMFDKLTLV